MGKEKTRKEAGKRQGKHVTKVQEGRCQGVKYWKQVHSFLHLLSAFCAQGSVVLSSEKM